MHTMDDSDREQLWRPYLACIEAERLEALREAFREEDGWPSVPEQSLWPSLTMAEDLAVLVRRELSEESYQAFLEHHPQLITGFCSWSDDSVLAFFSKPRFSVNWTPDFAAVACSQGGAYIILVEIERPSIKMFNKDLTFTKEVREPIRQVSQWKEEIDKDVNAFSRQVLSQTEKLPLLNHKNPQPSFRVRELRDVKKSWEAFGGNDYPHVGYKIVAGRWSSLSDRERKKFIHYNTTPRVADIWTYNQLLRHSYLRALGLLENYS